MYGKVVAVRGAIKIDSNTKEEIKQRSIELIKALLSKNKIGEKDIISIIFSVTDEITAYNPATSIRAIGFKRVPLMCLQEASFDGGMTGVIRVLVTYTSERETEPVFVYLNGAEKLRPDLKNGSNTTID